MLARNKLQGQQKEQAFAKKDKSGLKDDLDQIFLTPSARKERMPPYARKERSTIVTSRSPYVKSGL
jgi:hypothetical protein